MMFCKKLSLLRNNPHPTSVGRNERRPVWRMSLNAMVSSSSTSMPKMIRSKAESMVKIVTSLVFWESGLGGRVGRPGRTTRNPWADV